MTDDSTQSPADDRVVPAVTPRRRVASSFFVFLLLASIPMLWLTQIRGCSGGEIEPPRPYTAWQLLTFRLVTYNHYADPRYAWAGRIAFILLLVVGFILAQPRRPMPPLAVAGRCSIALLSIASVLFVIFSYPIYVGLIWGGDFTLEWGFFLGHSALVVVALLQLSTLVRLAPLLRHRVAASEPWRLVRGWTIPPVLANAFLTLVGVAAGVGTFVGCLVALVERPDAFSLFRLAAFLVVEANVATFCLAALVTTWGLLVRQRWAAWAQLAIILFIVGLTGFFMTAMGERVPGEFRYVRLVFIWPWVAIWLFILALAALATLLPAFLRSAALVQRARCAACGRRFWRRASQCPVCGETCWSTSDRVTAEACFGCGHEAARPLTCPPCALKTRQHARSRHAALESGARDPLDAISQLEQAASPAAPSPPDTDVSPDVPDSPPRTENSE